MTYDKKRTWSKKGRYDRVFNDGFTGNKCKKLQFIHTVNGDGWKTAKNHKKAMLTTLT